MAAYFEKRNVSGIIEHKIKIEVKCVLLWYQYASILCKGRYYWHVVFHIRNYFMWSFKLSVRVINALFIQMPTPSYTIAFILDVYINLALGTFGAGAFTSSQCSDYIKYWKNCCWIKLNTSDKSLNSKWQHNN